MKALIDKNKKYTINIVHSNLKNTYKHFREKRFSYNINKWNPNKTEVKKEKGKKFFFNLRSTEFMIKQVTIADKEYLLVIVCGSNDIADWFLNVFLSSWKGFKYAGWMEAGRIMKVLNKINEDDLPLIIGTHSKSGPTGWALDYLAKQQGIEVNSIIAFAPARGLRKAYRMGRTTLLIDKNDPVPYLAFFNFKHPIADIVYHPDKKKGLIIGDHFLSHWDNYLKEMKYIDKV